MIGWVDALTIKKTLSLFFSNKVEQTQHSQQLELSDVLKGCLSHTTSLVKKQLSTLKVRKHSRMYIWFGNTIMLKNKHLWNNKC